jgi:hypothetical protein
MLTTGATGLQAPPFLIFSGNIGDIPMGIVETYGDKCWVHAEEKGYMTKAAFVVWALKFADFIDEIRARDNSPNEFHLLLIDGHKSRIQPALMQALLHRGVILLCSPSHTTHLVQPNDANFNAHVHRAVDSYISQVFEANLVPSAETFANALIEGLQHESFPQVIKNSWAHVGAWPPDAGKRLKVMVRENIVKRTEASTSLEIAIQVTK